MYFLAHINLNLKKISPLDNLILSRHATKIRELPPYNTKKVFKSITMQILFSNIACGFWALGYFYIGCLSHFNPDWQPGLTGNLSNIREEYVINSSHIFKAYPAKMLSAIKIFLFSNG